jgi:hypothetical protein
VNTHDATGAEPAERPSIAGAEPAERPSIAGAEPAERPSIAGAEPAELAAPDWQHEARQVLPELTDVIRAGWSVHVLFTELLDVVREAHSRQDTQTLRRAYGFAHWCLRAPGAFLANAALVSFYELLFDEWEQRERVAPWLPPDAIEKVRPLWEWRLTKPALAEIDQLLGSQLPASPA